MTDLVERLTDFLVKWRYTPAQTPKISRMPRRIKAEVVARAAIAFILAEMKTPRVQAVMETAKLDGLHYLDKAESAATLIIGRQVDAIETEVGDE